MEIWYNQNKKDEGETLLILIIIAFFHRQFSTEAAAI